MEILENNKTVLVKGNVIGFEKSTLEPSKYLVQFPDLTTASLSVDMIEDELQKLATIAIILAIATLCLLLIAIIKDLLGL